MKRFAGLFTALDQTTSTNARVAALAAYFADAPEEDRLWTIALLSGRRPRRAVTTTRLREWAAERAGIPLWLFEECYPIVGDLAETIALILPPPTQVTDRSLTDWVTEVRALATLDEETRKARILAAWDGLDATERFLFNKLLTGGFRMGLSQKLMTRALAQATGIAEAELAHRLMGDWDPATTSYAALVLAPDPMAGLSRPYPFCLAHPLDTAPADLGDPADWAAEWKWDGIRGQVILRDGQHFLWSRGEELMTDRFPELARLADFLPPGTVIDGEVLAWDGTRPLPFSALQKRIGRKTVPKRLLSEAPVILKAYDLLEEAGEDIRALPYAERRARLDRLAATLPEDAPLLPSPLIAFDDWSDLAAVQRHRARAGRRGADAQASRVALRRGAQEGRLVEMEGRPPDHRRGDGLCPVRPWPACDPLHRLHLRRPRRRCACSVHQGLFGPDRRRVPRDHRLGAQEHAGTLWPRARRAPRACLRDRLRRHPAQPPPQVRHRAALSAHGALATGQTGGRGQYAGRSQGDA